MKGSGRLWFSKWGYNSGYRCTHITQTPDTVIIHISKHKG